MTGGTVRPKPKQIRRISMTTQLLPETRQFIPGRLDLPPPLDMDLVDAGRPTGWIADNAVGFRGFGDETEAAHAAWVAHRTLARRLARTQGGRPVPVDVEPLTIQWLEGKEMILASGRPIAALVRPGPESRSGVDSFGFEVPIPTPITELDARAMAHLMYRTLRKSGIRWALWRPDAPRVAKAADAPVSVGVATDTTDKSRAGTSDDAERPGRAAWNRVAAPTSRAPIDLTTALAVLSFLGAAILAVGGASLVTIPLAAALVAAVMLLRSRRLR
jgi:hypothetical protein